MVTSSDGARFLPVQVKYKNSRTGFSLRRADAARLEKTNAVIAFGAGEARLNTFYFYPSKDWASKAEDRARRDDKLVVYLSEEETQEWASQFQGKRGLGKAFHSVLPNA